jgi:hypothetical protein
MATVLDFGKGHGESTSKLSTSLAWSLTDVEDKDPYLEYANRYGGDTLHETIIKPFIEGAKVQIKLSSGSALNIPEWRWANFVDIRGLLTDAGWDFAAEIASQAAVVRDSADERVAMAMFERIREAVRRYAIHMCSPLNRKPFVSVKDRPHRAPRGLFSPSARRNARR